MTATTAHRGKIVSEAEFRRMWCDKSTPASVIADRLDVSVQAVTSRARIRGMEKRAGGGGLNRKLDPELFRKMWVANVGAAEIAAYFGLSHSNSISKRAREWGMPRRKCSRWNAISVAAFFLAETARAERAEWWNAEMVDGHRNRDRRAA